MAPPRASADAIAMALDEQGFAIVPDVLTDDELGRLRGELGPYLERTARGHEDFMGHLTKRFGALLAKCEMASFMVAHPSILEVADRVLLRYCARYQINYTGVMHLEPGERAQVLHRDTGIYPVRNPAPPMLLATMWAVTDFTKANGATCLVPGSHLWPDEREPAPNEIVAAEMAAGSVLIYTGNTIHGGGANRSSHARTGVALHYSLGWLRQEENQYLAVPPEQACRLPRRVQELMGYALMSVNLGFVDHRDPYEVLNGIGGDGPSDLGPPELYAADNAIQRFRMSDPKVSGRPRYRVEAELRSTRREAPDVG